MEELDLRELFRYYIKRIPIAILITLIAFLCGYIYVNYIQVPMYYASTTLILVENNEEDDYITQSSISINENLVNTYSEIIKSRRVLEKVIEELELDISVEGLSSMIEISLVENTPIIEIYVYDYSNESAVNIANKVAEVFKEEVMDIFNLENVSIVDEAIVDENAYPYNINVSSTLLICIMAGIVISFIVIFIMYYFDDTIKSKKDIEDRLGLAVLGEVPILEKLNKKKVIKKKIRKKDIDKISNNDEDKFKNIDNIDKLKKDNVSKRNSNRSNKVKKNNNRRSNKVEGGKQDERINSK